MVFKWSQILQSSMFKVQYPNKKKYENFDFGRSVAYPV